MNYSAVQVFEFVKQALKLRHSITFTVFSTLGVLLIGLVWFGLVVVDPSLTASSS